MSQRARVHTISTNTYTFIHNNRLFSKSRHSGTRRKTDSVAFLNNTFYFLIKRVGKGVPGQTERTTLLQFNFFTSVQNRKKLNGLFFLNINFARSLYCERQQVAAAAYSAITRNRNNNKKHHFFRKNLVVFSYG